MRQLQESGHRPGRAQAQPGTEQSSKRVNDLTQELKWLRKRQGLEARKIGRCPELLAVARQDCGGSEGAQDIDAYAYKFLLGRLHQLGYDLKTEALRKAGYNIAQSANDPFHFLRWQTNGAGASSVEARRGIFGASLGSSEARDPETIERWENEAAYNLAVRMVAHVGGHDPRSALAVNDPEPLPSTRRPYICERVDSTVRIGPNRVLVDSYNIREIRAIRDSVTFYLAKSSYPIDPGRDHQPVNFEPLTRCELINVESSEYDSRVYVAKLSLRRTLNRGDLHRLSYRVAVNSDVPALPTANFTAQAPVREYTIRVQFSRQALPSPPIWWYAGLVHHDVPGPVPGPEDGSILELDPCYYVERQFRNLAEGLCYGIAWRWLS